MRNRFFYFSYSLLHSITLPRHPYLYPVLKTALTKHRLDVPYEYDFFLVGISCHEKPYRLCWAINKTIELEMTLIDPLSISLKKNEPAVEFSRFRMENSENDIVVYLIANKNETSDDSAAPGILIAEHHQADYFFIANGPFTENDYSKMLSGIKEISFVLMSYRIDPATLKSKQNLLF